MSRRSTRRSSSVDPEDSADEAPSSRRSSRVTRSTLSVRETTTTRELRTPAATSGLGQYDQYDSGRPAARTRRSRAAEPSSSVDVSDILEEPDPDLFRVYPSPRSPSRVKAQEDAAVYRTDVCDSHDLEHLVTGFHAHAPHRATNLTAKSSIRTVSQKHYSLTSPNPRAHSHSHSHAHGPAGHDDHVDEPEDSSDPEEPEEPETSDVEEPGGGDVDPEGVDGTEEPEVEERAPRSFFGGLSCNLCSRNQDDADEDVVTVEDEPKHAGGDDEPTDDGQPDDSAVGDEQGVDAEPQEAEPSDEPGDDVEQSGDEVEEPGGDVDEPAEPADGGDDGSDVDGPEEPEPEPVDNGRPVDPNDPSGFVPLYDRIVGLCCATRQPADYPVECEDTSDDEVVLSADPSEPIELKAPARASKPASSQDSGDEDPDEVDPEPQEPASAAHGGDDGGDDVEAPQNPDEPVDVSGEDKPGFVPLYDRLLNLCRSAPSAEDEDDVNPDAAEPADDSGDEVEAPAKSVSPDDNGAGDDSGEEAAPPKPKAASADGRASSPLDEPASGDKSDSEPDDGVDGGEEVERKPRRPTALTSWLLLPFTVLSTLLSALGSAFVWFAQYLSGDDRDIEIWEAPIHVSLVYQPPVKSVETGGPSRGSQVEEEPIEEPADVDVDNGEAPDDNVEEPADGVEDPDEQSAASSDVDVDDGSDVDVDVEAPAHTSGAEPGEGGDFVENQGREGQSSETTSEPFDWRCCSRLWLPLALLLLLLLLLWASPLLVNWMLAFKGKPDCEHWKNCYKSVIGDIIIEQGGVGVVPGVILDSEVQKIKEAIVKELKPLSAEQVKEIVTKQTDPIAKKQEEFASQSEQSKKSVERQILDLQQTKQDSAKVQPLIDQAVGSAEEKSKQEIRAFQSKLDDAKQSILAEVNKLIAQIPKQPQTQTGTVAPATGATLTPEQLAEINKGVSDLSTRLEAFKGEVDKRFLALPAPGAGSSSGTAPSGISQQQLDSLKTDLLSELEKIKAQTPQQGSSAPVNEDAIVEKVLARIKTSSPEDLVAVQHQVQTVSAKLDQLAPAASVETLRVQYVELNTLFQNFVNKKNDDSNPNQQLPSDVSESLNKLSGDLTALKADLDKASTEIATIKAAQDSLPGAEALEALKAVDTELADKLDAHTKEVGDRLQELKASLGATDAIQALQTDLAAATQRLGELETGQAAAIKSAEDTQALVSTLSGSLEAQDNAFKQLQQLAKDLESQKISEAGALALIQNELKDHGKDALSVSDLYKILDKFSADRAAILSGVYQAPDLVDYAVQYAGGRVMLAETTRLVPAQTGLLADLIRTTHNNPHAAEELIKPDMDLGRCWAMAGSKGCVVIQLSKEIIPSSFTVEHPSHVIATDYSTAPKRLVFSGISEFDVTKKPRCADVHGDRLSVANYKEKDFQMQNFPSAPANNAVGKSYRFIKVDIEENHGNAEYTCIYRIRVQGKPVAAPPAVDANQPGSKRPAGARP